MPPIKQNSYGKKIQQQFDLRTEVGEGMVMKIDIDENSDKSVQVQLREALTENAVRVIDLFRDWDDDETGTITIDEWRKAMKQFGCDVAPVEIDALFNSFDPDGSGSIEYRELNKLLRRGQEIELAPELLPGGCKSRAEMVAMLAAPQSLQARVAVLNQLQAVEAEREGALDDMAAFDQKIETLKKSKPALSDSSWSGCSLVLPNL